MDHSASMNPTIIIAVYIALFVIDFLIEWTLDILNINSVLKNAHQIPLAFKDRISEESHQKSVQYTLKRARFGLIRSLWGTLLIAVILFTGSAAVLDQGITSLTSSAFLRSFLFLASASCILGLLEIPAALYSKFVIEEEFGFNTSGMTTFLSDGAKQLAVSGVILAVFLAGLQAVMNRAESMWWLYAWAFWTVFQLVMVVLYPIVIAPLFNKFEALPEGSLKERLEALAEREGFRNQGIFVMDGSRRSKHSNAYFTGMGRWRRIVIFDTLMEALEDEELEAVLAHEIGHWRHGHIKKRILVSLGLSAPLFALAAFILTWDPFFEAFGLGEPSLHGLLFWLSFIASPLWGLLSPLGKNRSRKHEYQADAFATRSIGDSKPMKEALYKLSTDNLSNLSPHPAYSTWHYSHPSLAERLAALDRLGEKS